MEKAQYLREIGIEAICFTFELWAFIEKTHTRPCTDMNAIFQCSSISSIFIFAWCYLFFFFCSLHFPFIWSNNGFQWNTNQTILYCSASASLLPWVYPSLVPSLVNRPRFEWIYFLQFFSFFPPLSVCEHFIEHSSVYSVCEQRMPCMWIFDLII